MAKTENCPWILERDGEEPMRFPSEQALWKWIHNNRPCSVDWAIKYEGYTIRKNNGREI